MKIHKHTLYPAVGVYSRPFPLETSATFSNLSLICHLKLLKAHTTVKSLPCTSQARAQGWGPVLQDVARSRCRTFTPNQLHQDTEGSSQETIAPSWLLPQNVGTPSIHCQQACTYPRSGHLQVEGGTGQCEAVEEGLGRHTCRRGPGVTGRPSLGALLVLDPPLEAGHPWHFRTLQVRKLKPKEHS